MLHLHVYAILRQNMRVVKGEKKMAITVTMKKATEESGLSMRTLQYAIARGELKSVTVGRRRLIPIDALRHFLLGREQNCPSDRRH
jgi:excisionase family DNA binding protein